MKNAINAISYIADVAMISDALNNFSLPPANWPPLDPSLLGDARPTPPAFPLPLLPGRWRAWVEDSAAVFGSADYLAHCLLGSIASVGGAGLRIGVASHWSEPLLLWQALVGGPSSGKSAAFARVAALLAEVRSGEASGDSAAPAVLLEAGLDPVVMALAGAARSVLLWREDLSAWMEEAVRRGGVRSVSRRASTPARPAWLAGWSAGPARLSAPGGGEWSKACLAIGIAGALSPERLAAFAEGDAALASRFLFAWPARGAVPSLADREADDAGLVALLQKIGALAGPREQPCIVPFDEAAARRLEALIPVLQQRAEAAEGVAAEWIGRGVPTLVRLAGLLSLMEWAETSELSGAAWQPVGVAHVEAAHALWSAYYLPQAMAVFGQAGVGPEERAARRVARWLRRVRPSRIGREDVRREALCQSVDAWEAEEVLARLEAGGAVRPVAVAEPTRRGPKRRRWEVNPALGRRNSAISASALRVPGGAENGRGG